jgi:hypothetical protein
MSYKITRTNQTRPCDLKIHRMCTDICKHINAVSNIVKLELYLEHNFMTQFSKLNINYIYPQGQPTPQKILDAHLQITFKA